MRCNESFACWLLACSLSLTNLTNGWAWIAYASISDFTSQYYEITLAQVNWITLLYSLIMVVGAVPIIWFIDHFGIKITLIISGVLNLLCAVARVLSSSSFVNKSDGYAILIVGSVLAGIAQPLGLFSATKLAATWFTSQNQVSANTLATMGNPLGIIISNLLSPIIATSANGIPMLNIVNIGPPVISLNFVLVSTYIAPKRLNTLLVHENISFLSRTKLCIKNIQFCLLALCLGIQIMIFTAISTLIQQMLCPLGYTNSFSGLCGALIFGLGFPGVLVIGYVVKKTQSLIEVVKWSVLMTSVGMLVLSITSIMSNQHFMVALSVSWMGLFGFGAYPSALELAAEVAFPAGEVISTGVLITIGQILGLIVIPVAQEIPIPAPELADIAACSVEDIKSYWILTTVLAIISVLNASIFMLLFNSNYKRSIAKNNQSTFVDLDRR